MEAQQCVKLSLTNRPFGLISSSRAQRTTAGAPNKIKRQANSRHDQNTYRTGSLQTFDKAKMTVVAFRRSGGYGEGPNTRSHPELGREILQRQWYCVLRRGRVGRRRIFKTR